jgi:hypothetical protein
VTNVPFSRDRSDRRSRLDRNTRRLREIVSVAVRYGLAERFRRLPGKQMQRWLRGSARVLEVADLRHQDDAVEDGDTEERDEAPCAHAFTKLWTSTSPTARAPAGRPATESPP